MGLHDRDYARDPDALARTRAHGTRQTRPKPRPVDAPARPPLRPAARAGDACGVPDPRASRPQVRADDASLLGCIVSIVILATTLALAGLLLR